MSNKNDVAGLSVARAMHAPTGADIRAIVTARRDEESAERAMADKIRTVYLQFTGKQIGKRFRDALGEALGGALVHLDRNSGRGGWTFFVWAGETGREFNNRLMLFLPSEERIAEMGGEQAAFEYENASFYRGTDARQLLRAQIDDTPSDDLSVCTKAANAILRYHLARVELSALFAYQQPLSPDEWAIKKAFDLDKAL